MLVNTVLPSFPCQKWSLRIILAVLYIAICSLVVWRATVTQQYLYIAGVAGLSVLIPIAASAFFCAERDLVSQERQHLTSTVTV